MNKNYGGLLVGLIIALKMGLKIAPIDQTRLKVKNDCYIWVYQRTV